MTPPKFGLFNSSFWTISSTAMPRLLFVSIALALALTPVEPAMAQPADSLAADSVAIIDSLQAALDRFEAAEPPTAADSTALYRWTDSLKSKGRSLRRRSPKNARRYFEEALRGYRALLDSMGVVSTVGNIGITHFYQSQYEKAMERYEQALAIYRLMGDRESIAAISIRIGILRWEQNRYEQALVRYRQALRITRDIENRRGVAIALNNIGNIRNRQGQYEEALTQYQKALRIHRALEDRRGIARAISNIAIVYSRQGQYEKAEKRYREVLQIEREIASRRSVAITLNNLGGTLQEQGKYEEAFPYHQEALQIGREINDSTVIAGSLNNIGAFYQNRGEYKESSSLYRKAITTYRDVGYREVGDRAGMTKSLTNIGRNHLEMNQLQSAVDTLRWAIKLGEELRLNATSPDARRSLLSTQITTYRSLVTAHVRSEQPDSALRAVEQARARLLTDRLAGTATGDTSFALPSADELRRTLDRDEAALLYANAGSKWPLTALVVTRDTTVARELPDSTALAAIESEYPTQLNRLRREKGPLTAAMDQNASSGPGTTPSLAEIIRLYRYHLVREQTDASIQSDLARRLHGLLVEPVTDALADKSELIAVPTGALGYLPFETLQDSTGQYLVEDKHVRYAQSLTVRRQLRQRNYADRERPLLALGGAAYEQDPKAETGSVVAEARGGSTRVATRGHAATLVQDANRRMKQGKSPRPTYQQLGYAGWRNLPGTQSEVEELGEIFGEGVTVLTGAGASEESVRTLDEQGRLRQYRRVHFATHGIAVPETPELSALVLSQVGASDSLAARDGYLTMEEIADLDLRADVAVLSACQTGLGKIVAGEGVVSLSHAFLRAGANATLVSQWKVLDESTRRFMTAVYKRSEKAGTSFAEAVTETKRAFIAGEHGAKNTDPLRWAPFVYYGRE